MLVDTLLAARAHAPQTIGDARPLLGWLLATALHTLRSRIGADPVLESGIEHHRAGLPLRLSAGLHQTLPRLSRVEQLALGMRFADALPVAVIAQAMMGRSERAVHALLGTALARIGRACYPPFSPTRPEPEQLDYYVSALLAGDHAAPPDSLRLETVAIVTALVGLHTSVEVVPGLHERVWHEYGQRREEYVPSRPFPSAPTWLLPMGLILLLALALGAGSYWLISRVRCRRSRGGSPERRHNRPRRSWPRSPGQRPGPRSPVRSIPGTGPASAERAGGPIVLRAARHGAGAVLGESRGTRSIRA